MRTCSISWEATNRNPTLTINPSGDGRVYVAQVLEGLTWSSRVRDVGVVHQNDGPPELAQL